MQLCLRHPDRISAAIFFVPGSGGICPACIEKATNPPRWLLDALYRFNFPMWLITKLAPKFTYTLMAVPAPLVPTLSPDARAELDESITNMFPVSQRRLGVLNEGNTQGTQIRFPLSLEEKARTGRVAPAEEKGCKSGFTILSVKDTII